MAKINCIQICADIKQLYYKKHAIYLAQTSNEIWCTLFGLALDFLFCATASWRQSSIFCALTPLERPVNLAGRHQKWQKIEQWNCYYAKVTASQQLYFSWIQYDKIGLQICILRSGRGGFKRSKVDESKEVPALHIYLKITVTFTFTHLSHTTYDSIIHTLRNERSGPAGQWFTFLIKACIFCLRPALN